MDQEVRFWLNVADVAHRRRYSTQTFMQGGHTHLAEAVAYAESIWFRDLKHHEAARLVPDDDEFERLIDTERRYYRGHPPERLYEVPPTRTHRFRKLIESDPRLCRCPQKAWGRLRQKFSDGELTVHLLLSDGSLWTFPAEFWRANTDTAAWAFHRDRLRIRVANPDPYSPPITYFGYPIVFESELEAVVAGAAAAGQTMVHGHAPDCDTIPEGVDATPSITATEAAPAVARQIRKRGPASMAALDAPLVEEMSGLIEKGMKISTAAKRVADRAGGSNVFESRAQRLERRWREKQKTGAPSLLPVEIAPK